MILRSPLTLIFLSILIVGISFSSCTKDDEEPSAGTPALTAEQKLTGNEWTLVSATTTEEDDCDDDGEFDFEQVPACYEDCDLDDFLDLNEDHTYTWNEGLTICSNSSGEQVYEMGTWSLNDAVTLLTLTEDDGNSYGLHIQSLSATELVFIDTYEWNGDTITEVETYH